MTVLLVLLAAGACSRPAGLRVVVSTTSPTTTRSPDRVLADLFTASAMAACLRAHGFDHGPQAYDLRGRPDATIEGVAALGDGDGNEVVAGWDAQTGFTLTGPGDSDKEREAVAACGTPRPT